MYYTIFCLDFPTVIFFSQQNWKNGNFRLHYPSPLILIVYYNLLEREVVKKDHDFLQQRTNDDDITGHIEISSKAVAHLFILARYQLRLLSTFHK